ncbi:SDR family NAD(P)-dependent oxidoreductase [Gordonia soli]|uniref:Putative oxidoreductase n=1 Tax=Gordonia soli NBRC 108243 TaxID=1223545 RepID=M0QMH5_9ACTN|nr:SDR family NAD(P)-dependent oxidoreductase [Gordonia soli]GAC69624.1 putative oxidoreductase [Gordonia soli NBRC 108243]
MSRRTRGAHAVVTGAGSGIGRAFALELARRGGNVICADIDVDRAAGTVEMIGQLPAGRATAFFCDVSQTDDIDRLGAFAREHFGGPTTLMINNAGVGIGGRPVGEIGVDDWQWALGINLWGMVYGSEVFVPQLREAGYGGLINVASAAAFAAAPGMAAYNVGKAGVLALSETISAELAGTKLAVTVLCPTFVKTNVAADGRITGEAMNLAQNLMRHTGADADRVARRTLDAHDRGRLHVVPQIDAKAVWLGKRLAPGAYTYGAGLLNRLLPQATSPTTETADAGSAARTS